MENNIDYNRLLKSEVVRELECRDDQVTELKTKIELLESQLTICKKQVKDLSGDGGQPVSGGGLYTAENIIEAVCDLSGDEIAKLPGLLRTTDKGIEAFTAFNYGGISCASGGGLSNPGDGGDPDCGCPDIPDESYPT